MAARTAEGRTSAALKAAATMRARREQLGIVPAKRRTKTAAEKQIAFYITLSDAELLATLQREQCTLERWASHKGLGGWTRITDVGEAISGGSLGGAIARRHIGYTQGRIDRLENVLSARNVDADVVNAWRFGEVIEFDTAERDGLALDSGDVSFDVESF